MPAKWIDVNLIMGLSIKWDIYITNFPKIPTKRTNTGSWAPWTYDFDLNVPSGYIVTKVKFTFNVRQYLVLEKSAAPSDLNNMMNNIEKETDT